MALRYIGRQRTLVRGPMTGRAYEFSRTRPVRDIDAEDVEGLLRTGAFRRAG